MGRVRSDPKIYRSKGHHVDLASSQTKIPFSKEKLAVSPRPLVSSWQAVKKEDGCIPWKTSLSHSADRSIKAVLANVFSEKYPKRDKIDIQDILNPSDDDQASSVESSPCLSVKTPATSCNGEIIDRDHTHDKEQNPQPRGEEPRESRPPYDLEQAHFIWYHHVDRDMRWAEVEETYNAYWSGLPRKRSGMQCKLYRLTKDMGIPDIRKRPKRPGADYEFGMRRHVKERYPWMELNKVRLPGE